MNPGEISFDKIEIHFRPNRIWCQNWSMKWMNNTLFASQTWPLLFDLVLFWAFGGYVSAMKNGSHYSYFVNMYMSFMKKQLNLRKEEHQHTITLEHQIELNKNQSKHRKNVTHSQMLSQAKRSRIGFDLHFNYF